MADPLISSGVNLPIYSECGPPAIHADGKTTIVFQGPSTKTYAVQYDHASGLKTGPYKVSDYDADGPNDRHGGRGLARVASTGVLHAFGSVHAHPMGWARSDSPDDIRSWSDMGPIGIGDAAYSSYPNCIDVDGVAYVFFRSSPGEYQVDSCPLYMMRIVDDAPQTPTLIYDPGGNDWIYPCGIMRRGDNLYVSFHPRQNADLGKRRDPAVVCIDTANADAISDVFGNPLSTPLTQAEFDNFARIEDTGAATGSTNTGVGLRLDFDENDAPYAVYTKKVSEGYVVRYADGSSGSWALSDLCPNYDEGRSEIIVNASDDIDVFVIQSDGTIDRYNDGAHLETLDTGSTATNYLTRVVDYRPELKLLIADMDAGDFENADVKVFAWGDSGFLNLASDDLDGHVSSIPHRRSSFASDTTRITGDNQDYRVVLVPESAAGAGDGIPWEALDLNGSNAAQPDGGDVRVSADEDGNVLLPMFIDRWEPANDPSAATARIVVKVPNWRASQTDMYYLHWGFGDYSSATPQAPTGQFAALSGMRRVYRFRDALPSGVLDELTEHRARGALENVQHLAQRDSDIDFLNIAGSGDDPTGTAYGTILLPIIGSMPTGTLVTVINPDDVSSGRVFAHSDTVNNARIYFGVNNGQIRFRLGGGNETNLGTVQAGVISAFGLRWSAGESRLYKDGAYVGASPYSDTPGSDEPETRLGAYGSPGIETLTNPYEGKLFDLWLFEDDLGSDAPVTYTDMLSSPVGIASFGPPQPAAVPTSVFPDSATHSQMAEQASITVAHTVTVQDTDHAHTADNVGLTVAASVSPNDAEHAHTADAVGISQVHGIAINDASHGQTADNCSLGVAGTISPQDTLHSQSADTVGVSQHHALIVQDAEHGHTADQAVISQGLRISPNDTEHAHTADSLGLGQWHQLIIADAVHAHTAESMAFFQTHVVEPEDCLHAQMAANMFLLVGEDHAPPDRTIPIGPDLRTIDITSAR